MPTREASLSVTFARGSRKQQTDSQRPGNRAYISKIHNVSGGKARGAEEAGKCCLFSDRYHT